MLLSNILKIPIISSFGLVKKFIQPGYCTMTFLFKLNVNKIPTDP